MERSLCKVGVAHVVEGDSTCAIKVSQQTRYSIRIFLLSDACEIVEYALVLLATIRYVVKDLYPVYNLSNQ